MSSPYDLRDFQADVVARSATTPVLVDFWADWCGPCKMLGPILEKLAGEAAGRWTLVKVDSDLHQDLAAQFDVRGIPDVRLFHHGTVIAHFSGAMPEPQLRQWLEDNLPTPKRATLARARELLLAGRAAEAAALLRPLAGAEPGDAEVAVLAARALVFSEPDAALALVSTLPPASPWNDDAHRVRTLGGSFLRAAAGAADLAHAPRHADYLAALRQLQAQQFREGLTGLVAILEDKPDFDAGRAKAVTLATFQHLGMRHPVTDALFRRYSMAVNV